MRSRTGVLAAILATAPLGARAADLVLWWDEGFYAEEAEAIRRSLPPSAELGKQVELGTLMPEIELPTGSRLRSKSGRPPTLPTACGSHSATARQG